MLKKLICSNLDDLWLFAGVEGGIFLLLEIIIGCVMFFVRPEDGVSLAWMILPFIAGGLSLFMTGAHATVTFELALRFGQTRRRAMGQFMALSALESALGFVLAAGLAALERSICPALWVRLAGLEGWVRGRTASLAALPDVPGMEAGSGRVFINAAGEIVPLPEHTLLIRDFTLDWYWQLLIFAAALAMGFIIGALVQRFGQKGLWVVWGFWMALMFSPQLLRWEIFDRVSRSLPTLLPLVAGLSVTGLLLWSVWSMLHAVVKT